MIEIKKELFTNINKYNFIVQELENKIRTQIEATDGESTVCENCLSTSCLFFSFSTFGGIQKLCPVCNHYKFVKKSKNKYKYKSKRKDNSGWSSLVRENDNNQCHICGSTDDIQAHHIIPVCVDESLQYEESNGICLCKKCHDKVHSTDWWNNKDKLTH